MHHASEALSSGLAPVLDKHMDGCHEEITTIAGWLCTTARSTAQRVGSDLLQTSIPQNVSIIYKWKDISFQDTTTFAHHHHQAERLGKCDCKEFLCPRHINVQTFIKLFGGGEIRDKSNPFTYLKFFYYNYNLRSHISSMGHYFCLFACLYGNSTVWRQLFFGKHMVISVLHIWLWQ